MILIERCLRRSRLAEELVEEWQVEHKNGMASGEIQELASECLQVGKLAQHVWDLVSDALMDARIDDVETVGHKLELIFQKTLRVLGRVKAVVDEAQSSGLEIEVSGDLGARLQDIESAVAEFTRLWPKANPQLAEESLAAYHRGEFSTAEDLLSAQSLSSEAN